MVPVLLAVRPQFRPAAEWGERARRESEAARLVELQVVAGEEEAEEKNDSDREGETGSITEVAGLTSSNNM